MAEFKSEKKALNVSAETAFDKLKSPGALRPLLDKIPADQIPADKRAMFEQIQLTDDSITLPGGPMGSVTLRVANLERPSRIELRGEGVPVELVLRLDLTPTGEDSSEAQVSIILGVPKMLESMLLSSMGGTLQKIVNQFADVLTSVPLG